MQMTIRNRDIDERFEIIPEMNKIVQQIRAIGTKTDRFGVKRQKNIVLIHFWYPEEILLLNLVEKLIDENIPHSSTFDRVETKVKIDIEDTEPHEFEQILFAFEEFYHSF